MGEESHNNSNSNVNHHHHHNHRAAASRLGLGIRTASSSAATTVGEIVEARGGHIIRATGRKDRHSKVCTAKGPRDRRVRLAAHTAIQFYDVQDRLGYDRPSKAVDWLIKKAKAAIDELDELPPWNPNSASASASAQLTTTSTISPVPISESLGHRFTMATEAPISSSSANRRTAAVAELLHQNNSSNFLPPSMDSDSIADTIKSFFPMGAATASAETSPFHHHHSYPPDLLSRTSSHSQDLRLSLQSFQDPILLHHHHPNQNEPAFLSGTANPLGGFDNSAAATWTDQHQHHHHSQQQAELNRFQRMVAWNSNAGAESNNPSGGGGFTFSSVPMTTLQPFLFGGHQSHFFPSQRGPLQSSNTPSVHAWIDHNTNNNDPSSISDQMATQLHQSSSIHPGMGFASGGFSGFHIPARIQGEEEHDGISDKPSSASSNSRH